MDKVIRDFAKKWKIHEDTVRFIFRMIDDYGSKYGKVSRALDGMGFHKSPRQLKYFYKKTKIHIRLNISRKGRPRNYIDILRREA